MFTRGEVRDALVIRFGFWMDGLGDSLLRGAFFEYVEGIIN